MKTSHRLPRIIVGSLLLQAATLPALCFEPVAPASLKAEVNGIEVNLSWDWGNAGTEISNTGFESDTLPTSWSTRDTYAASEGFNWLIYTPQSEDEMFVVNSGQRCALLMPADTLDPDNPSAAHQDEWLIVRPGSGASYLDFSYFLHPTLLENGAYPDFPDHYYVKVSWDNGKSWTELWDGRWDMGSVMGMQRASLFLGDETDENTLVAFEAVSGPEESLYFLWSIDDVLFRAADGTPTSSSMVSNAPGSTSMHQAVAGNAPADGGSIGTEWLNSGNITYRVYCDDKMVGDYIKALHFSDSSDKVGGSHTYRVMAWSEALNKEYEAASVQVDIQDFTTPAPRNLVASYEETSPGRYTVSASWEAPEGDRQPTSYCVYLNGKSIGWADDPKDLSLGQSGLFKGVYTFEVEAVYDKPQGTSERISATVAPGTVLPPLSLKATKDGATAVLSWGAPAGGVEYTVYRGDALIGSTTDCTFTDPSPAAGINNYSVHACYADGAVSPAAEAFVTFAGLEPYPAPLYEGFSHGHLPLNWNAELIDPYDKVKAMYNWSFCNWFDSDFSEASAILNGGFASISGVASGMNRLEVHLTSPAVQYESGCIPMVTFTKAFFEPKAGPSGAAQFTFRYSIDGGDTWNDVADLTKCDNGLLRYEFPDAAGGTLQVRWSFLARNSGIAAIDNVAITTTADNAVDTLTDSTEAPLQIHDIHGHALRHYPTQPGLYIINGRKVMIHTK